MIHGKHSVLPGQYACPHSVQKLCKIITSGQLKSTMLGVLRKCPAVECCKNCFANHIGCADRILTSLVGLSFASAQVQIAWEGPEK